MDTEPSTITIDFAALQKAVKDLLDGGAEKNCFSPLPTTSEQELLGSVEALLHSGFCDYLLSAPPFPADSSTKASGYADESYTLTTSDATLIRPHETRQAPAELDSKSTGTQHNTKFKAFFKRLPAAITTISAILTAVFAGLTYAETRRANQEASVQFAQEIKIEQDKIAVQERIADAQERQADAAEAQVAYLQELLELSKDLPDQGDALNDTVDVADHPGVAVDQPVDQTGDAAEPAVDADISKDAADEPNTAKDLPPAQ